VIERCASRRAAKQPAASRRYGGPSIGFWFLTLSRRGRFGRPADKATHRDELDD
jgi:hypothetical protein